jgi:hypothetical protein
MPVVRTGVRVRPADHEGRVSHWAGRDLNRPDKPTTTSRWCGCRSAQKGARQEPVIHASSPSPGSSATTLPLLGDCDSAPGRRRCRPPRRLCPGTGWALARRRRLLGFVQLSGLAAHADVLEFGVEQGRRCWLVVDARVNDDLAMHMRVRGAERERDSGFSHRRAEENSGTLPASPLSQIVRTGAAPRRGNCHSPTYLRRRGTRASRSRWMHL